MFIKIFKKKSTNNGTEKDYRIINDSIKIKKQKYTLFL